MAESDLLADEVAETSAPLVWVSQRRGGIPEEKGKKKRITHTNVSLISGKCSMLWKMSSAAIGTGGGDVAGV